MSRSNFGFASDKSAPIVEHFQPAIKENNIHYINIPESFAVPLDHTEMTADSSRYTGTYLQPYSMKGEVLYGVTVDELPAAAACRKTKPSSLIAPPFGRNPPCSCQTHSGSPTIRNSKSYHRNGMSLRDNMRELGTYSLGNMLAHIPSAKSTLLSVPFTACSTKHNIPVQQAWEIPR